MLDDASLYVRYYFVQVRKEVELLAKWDDEMLDLNSAKFMSFADGVEQRVRRSGARIHCVVIVVMLALLRRSMRCTRPTSTS